MPPGVKIDRVPVAVLDTYDGAVWGTNASFAVAGQPAPLRSFRAAARTAWSTRTIRSDRYGLSFLPALGRPIRITGTHLAFDRVSGMLATATPRAARVQVQR